MGMNKDGEYLSLDLLQQTNKVSQLAPSKATDSLVLVTCFNPVHMQIVWVVAEPFRATGINWSGIVSNCHHLTSCQKTNTCLVEVEE